MAVEFIGYKELSDAIKRFPQKSLDEGRLFLTRGMAVYKKGIIREPWRVGGIGGGSPVSNDPLYKRKNQKQRSGNLRDTHVTEISDLQATIGPNDQTAPYAKYVHEGTRRMMGRPWLDYIKRTKDPDIQKLYQAMLGNIVSDLAK